MGLGRYITPWFLVGNGGMGYWDYYGDEAALKMVFYVKGFGHFALPFMCKPCVEGLLYRVA